MHLMKIHYTPESSRVEYSANMKAIYSRIGCAFSKRNGSVSARVASHFIMFSRSSAPKPSLHVKRAFTFQTPGEDHEASSCSLNTFFRANVA